MTTNTDITIFNKRYIPDERTEKLVSTHIYGVSLYAKKGASSGSGELKQGDSYVIRIPADAYAEGKEYAGQKEYEAMDDDVYVNYWTLDPGTIIVRGIIDLDSASETELKEKYQDVIFVTNFTDNRDFCSDFMKHWRVGGE